MRQLEITSDNICNILGQEEPYLRDISAHIDRFPDDGDEIALIQRARQGDEKALNLLLSDNLRFVVHEVKQYVGKVSSEKLCDLVNAGVEGIKSAVEHFDMTHGIKFCFYELGWIRQAIYDAIYDSDYVDL